MKIKKLLIILPLLLLLVLAASCGEDSAKGKYFLTANEVNYFTLEENPQDLSALGEAIKGTKDMIVALDAPSADYILNSLDSIGEIEAENLEMDFNLNGEGDYSQLSSLSSIKGLTAITIAGINDFSDVSVFNTLSDLTSLTLKDQNISDFSPLSQCPSLTDLSLSGENINYTTLPSLDVENITIPVADNNWVALTLLKNNENLKTINSVAKESFNVAESLEPEQKYYNYQFEDVIYITKKKQEITAVNTGNPSSITGNMVVAATPGLLQTSYYADQQLLKTACGISEEETDPKIFFPYIQDYATAGTDSTYLKFAGTDYMNEQFITAVDIENAKYIVYVYAMDESGNFTTDYSQGQLWIYAQIYDIENNAAYGQALIYQSALGGEENAATYQQELLNALNDYLAAIPVNTL